MQTKTQDIHERLVSLGDRLAQAEEKLQRHAYISSDHKATNLELRERYQRLQEGLNRDVQNAESHGVHISALEKSVRLWLEQIMHEGG
jgi:hypothetical protein